MAWKRSAKGGKKSVAAPSSQRNARSFNAMPELPPPVQMESQEVKVSLDDAQEQEIQVPTLTMTSLVPSSSLGENPGEIPLDTCFGVARSVNRSPPPSFLATSLTEVFHFSNGNTKFRTVLWSFVNNTTLVGCGQDSRSLGFVGALDDLQSCDDVAGYVSDSVFASYAFCSARLYLNDARLRRLRYYEHVEDSLEWLALLARKASWEAKMVVSWHIEMKIWEHTKVEMSLFVGRVQESNVMKLHATMPTLKANMWRISEGEGENTKFRTVLWSFVNNATLVECGQDCRSLGFVGALDDLQSCDDVAGYVSDSVFADFAFCSARLYLNDARLRRLRSLGFVGALDDLQSCDDVAGYVSDSVFASYAFCNARLYLNDARLRMLRYYENVEDSVEWSALLARKASWEARMVVSWHIEMKIWKHTKIDMSLFIGRVQESNVMRLHATMPTLKANMWRISEGEGLYKKP
ncbi:hypothetical protein L7F22_047046 [Adiantum nelumboides]|nr:hypothetical protein [Adiantum nelumboides]